MFAEVCISGGESKNNLKQWQSNSVLQFKTLTNFTF